jgi:hypothetical protein
MIEFNAVSAFKDYSTVMFALVNTTPFFALIGDKSRRFCDAPPTGSSAIFANCSLISGNIALFSTKIQNALRAADLRKLALLCLL